MTITFAPGITRQAESDAADADPTTARIGAAMLEAVRGQQGARFTLRRALALADQPTASGPELRRRVLAAVVCADWHTLSGLLTDSVGAPLSLRAGEPASEAAPADVFACTLEPAGRLAFELPLSVLPSPYLGYVVSRWLAVLPVFAAALRSGQAKPGRCRIALGTRDRRAGLAFCSARAEAHLLPDPDFLNSRGYPRLRHAPPADWAARPSQVLCPEPARGGPKPGEAVQVDGVVFATPGAGGVAPRYALEAEQPMTGSSALFASLLSGACLLRAAAPGAPRLWLHDRLVAWEHFVPVAADLSDLAAQVAWLQANDAAAQEMAGRGRAVALAAGYEAELGRAAKVVAAAFA